MINAQPGGASSPKAKIAPRKFRRAGPRASFGQPPPVLRRSPGLLPQSFRQKTLPSSPPCGSYPSAEQPPSSPWGFFPSAGKPPRASFGQPSPTPRRSPSSLPQTFRQKNSSAGENTPAPRFLRTTAPNPAPGLRASFLNPPGGKALPPSSGFIPSAGKTPPARALPSGHRPSPSPLPGLTSSILPAEKTVRPRPPAGPTHPPGKRPAPRFLRTTDPGPAPARGLPFQPRPLPPLESPSFFGSRRP